jgi:hypothetical protein
MNVGDAAGCQRPLLVAAFAQQVGVKPLQMHRPKLLDSEVAEARDDIKPEQLPITLKRFRADV